MKRQICWWVVLTALVGGAAATTAVGNDWPQWRGPHRDGQLVGWTAPAAWPKRLTKRWTIEVGQGHSSPVVQGQHVFVFARQDDQEVVRCVDLASGRVLWQQRYAAPYEVNPAARRHGKGPKSTPAVADGRVFTLGISGILSGWDAATGRQLWQHTFSDQFPKTSPLYGTATSPLVVDQLCIAHVGGHGKGALCAFDVKSGALRWSWDGDGPAYTSPIVATIGGARQLVSQSQEHSIGVRLPDGKLLWKEPYTTQFTMNIVTPVVLEDVVVFSGYRRGTTAYRITRDGDRWSAEQQWHNGDVSMFMNSPVLIGGRLFGLAQEQRGKLFCLDPATGKLLWTGPPRAGDNAALVWTDSALLVLTTGADLIVVDPAASAYREVSRYKVADTPTWAHPAIVDNQILVKDAEHLTLWEIQSAAGRKGEASR